MIVRLLQILVQVCACGRKDSNAAVATRINASELFQVGLLTGLQVC